ncbi:hypothetical protein IFR04_012085 [Cadophora malorum]|uniref:Rhomboid family membrane protein n=1 Tax=Cadophora malorum TaxID=108018 RepID=A0A8H7T7Y6_9HELO|nr:hypothetical protein IFR04_012085 [Cadophora malorum]
MSTTTTTPTTPLNSRDALYRNVALGAVVVCPIIILIPPRKIDIYTVALTAGFFAGGNHLAAHYTGTSILQRFGNRMEHMSSHALPPKALETQRRLKEEREKREAGTLARDVARLEAADDRGVLAEVRRKEAEHKERGLLEKVWMGREGPDWKAKRDLKEKEALDEGRGYGGLIMDQIWEVWSWGKDKVEEVKEVDEKVVQERKEGKK